MPRTNFEAGRYNDLMAKAMDAGHLRHEQDGGKSVLKWKAAGRCQSPVHIELASANITKGLRTRTGDLKATERTAVRTMELEGRCRKCPACLLHRARLWTARAKAETVGASRTWFGTLTLRPDRHFDMLSRARHRHARRACRDLDAEPPEVVFRARVSECNKEITKYLKRVRKQSGADLRYILTAEAHKSGLPHFHALVHEVSDQTVTHRVLSDQWKEGFSKWKLVADDDQKKAAYYVCKYLTKSSLARVRASRGYGRANQ